MPPTPQPKDITMSDFAQLAALGRAFANGPLPMVEAPKTIPGLEELGRSTHGGRPDPIVAQDDVKTLQLHLPKPSKQHMVA